MNYYIQGNKDKADQIKAAFEKMGYNVNWHRFDDSTTLFFTAEGYKPVLLTCDAGSAYADIIKTHPDYKELELPVEPKFKDGDVLVTTKIRSCPFIYRKTDNNDNLAYYYVGIDGNGKLSIGWPKNTLCHFGFVTNAVIAGQGQRDLLFKKMKEAGYQWDAEKKELRKIKPHYDITDFKPFDKVLVRDGCEKWGCEIFSHYEKAETCPFITCASAYKQCIPFNDDTKHLLGTTDMCDEQYINW